MNPFYGIGGWAVMSFREMSRDHIMVFADQGVGDYQSEKYIFIVSNRY